MKKSLNLIAAVLFVLNLIIYILFITGASFIPDATVIFPYLISSSLIGFVLALMGENSKLRTVAIWGNLFVIFIAIILPEIVGTFIFNRS